MGVTCDKYSHHIIMTPATTPAPAISTLPPELLTEIFLHTGANGYFSAQVHKLPLTLGLVCRYWRVVTLQTHHLWSNLTLDTTTSRLTREKIKGVNLWLSRSGDVQCRVSIRIRSFNDRHPTTMLPSILRPIAGRVGKLFLDVSMEMLLSLSTPPNVEFTQLRSLSLMLSHRPDPPLPLYLPAHFHFLETLPALRYINIKQSKGDHHMGLRLFQAIPWNQLTTCKISGNSFSREITREILRLCSNTLVEISIDSIEEGSVVFGPSRILYPNLATMELFLPFSRHLHIEDTFSSFLDSMSLPSLSFLVLDGRRSITESTLSASLLRLFSEGTVPLTFLAITAIPLHLDVLIQVLRLAPSLLHLTLFYCRVLRNEFFLCLCASESPETTPILPVLDSVTIKDTIESTEGSLSIDSILEFLESRFRPDNLDGTANRSTRTLRHTNVAYTRGDLLLQARGSQRCKALLANGLALWIDNKRLTLDTTQS